MESNMRGSCLCNGVQFSITDEPENVFICHCSHCTKNAGGPGQISAKFKRENVRITRGEGLLKSWIVEDTLSLSEKHKVFCSQCGCTLWTIPMKHGGGHWIVRTSLIDDGFKRLPYRMEFFASRKADASVATGVKSFDTMPGY